MPCGAAANRLKKSAVIEGYSVRLNARALGLAGAASVRVTCNSHFDNTLEKICPLAVIPYVIDAWRVSGVGCRGNMTISIHIAIKNTIDHQRLPRVSLEKIKGIRLGKSSFMLRPLN